MWLDEVPRGMRRALFVLYGSDAKVSVGSEGLDYRIVFRLSSLIEKERGYMHELKLVPTVLINGQNELRPKSWTQSQMQWEKRVIL